MPAVAWILIGVGTPVVLLAIAIRLAMRARGARRVGDHPHCARCGYDLIATSREGQCPECGGELRDVQAIVIGQPTTSRIHLAAGTVACIAAISVAVGISPGILRSVDWQEAKPTFLLRWEMARGDLDAAVRLSRRLAAGSLSGGQIVASAEVALEKQADPAFVWHRALGDVIEGARHRDVLSDEAWRAYARHAAQPYIETRQAVRAGDEIPLRLWLGPSRMDGSAWSVPDAAGRISSTFPQSSPWPQDEQQFAFRYQIVGHRFGDGPLLPAEDPFADKRSLSWLPHSSIDPRTVASHGYPIRLRVPDDQSLGPTTLRVVFDLKVVQPTLTRGNEPLVPDVVLAEWRQEFEVPVKVVPAGTETVELVETPALREAVEAAATRPVTHFYEHDSETGRSERHTAEGIVENEYGYADAAFGFHERPIAVAFDVWLRLPDGRRVGHNGDDVRPLDQVVAEVGGRGVGLHVSRAAWEVLRRERPGAVEMLLVPSPDAARRCPTIDRIFGGEVVIEGVPVVFHDDEERR